MDGDEIHDFPYTATFTANEESEERFVIVFGERAIALKLFIEGYYNSSANAMESVMENQGTDTNPTYVGYVEVGLSSDWRYGCRNLYRREVTYQWNYRFYSLRQFYPNG